MGPAVMLSGGWNLTTAFFETSEDVSLVGSATTQHTGSPAGTWAISTTASLGITEAKSWPSSKARMEGQRSRLVMHVRHVQRRRPDPLALPGQPERRVPHGLRPGPCSPSSSTFMLNHARRSARRPQALDQLALQRSTRPVCCRIRVIATTTIKL
jgi:hypothetical protein